jgi:catalase
MIYDHREGNDDFTPAGKLFRIMSAEDQGRLMDTITGAMEGVPDDIDNRQVGYFHKVDPGYGNDIMKRLVKNH